jgi:trigger factor
MSSAAQQADAGKSLLVRKPESAVELTLSAPGNATKAAYDKACSEVAKTISIPGFRKGAKIPPAVIENAMAAKGNRNALRIAAIQSLLNQLLEPALKEEHNLEPIGQPTLVTSVETLAESFKPGEPIQMTVQCDVWPDIKWKTVDGQEKPYIGLKGKYTREPFNQQKYDQAMKDLLERYAVVSPAPEGKTLAMGDACVVNMTGYMAAADGITKADPLPNAASGDDVEVILGTGRYMEGLVEGLVGAKVGETKTIYVTFPNALRDKTLAGKKAVFDVTVNEANTRVVPELNDELAGRIRPGLNAENIRAELRKAVDEQDSEKFVPERNKAIAQALAQVMDVEVPDTLITNQAREKYAQMMADFRTNGMADEDIKAQITPENFQKYKNIEKPDIIKDFKISMATDDIARMEKIEVPAYQIDEQLEAVRKEANGEDLGDETVLRNKIESTIMRRLVYDFLAEHAELEVEYKEAEQFDEALMEQLARESIEREEKEKGKTIDVTTTVSDQEDRMKAEAEAKAKAETEAKAKADADAKSKVEAKAEAEAHSKLAEKNQRMLLQAALKNAKAEAEAKSKAEADVRSKLAEKNQRMLLQATLKNAKVEAEAKAKAVAGKMAEKNQRMLLQAALKNAKVEAEAKAKAEASKLAEKNQRMLLQAALKNAKAEAETKAKANNVKSKAIQQPKSEAEKKALSERYASMDLEERAFNILLDLGMIELTPDPDSPDYDHSNDHESA